MYRSFYYYYCQCSCFYCGTLNFASHTRFCVWFLLLLTLHIESQIRKILYSKNFTTLIHITVSIFERILTCSIPIQHWFTFISPLILFPSSCLCICVCVCASFFALLWFNRCVESFTEKYSLSYIRTYTHTHKHVQRTHNESGKER